MNRKEKIELLNGIAKGNRQLKELSIIHDPIIIDKNDNRPIITAAKGNVESIVLSEDIESLEADELMKGFAVNLKTYTFSIYN
ncbi:MAG: hypothetical protein ACTHM7_14185 [Ginsengibacter sp.]